MVLLALMSPAPQTCSSAPWRGPTNQAVPQVLRAGDTRDGGPRVPRAEFRAPGIPLALTLPALTCARLAELGAFRIPAPAAAGPLSWRRLLSRNHPEGKSSPGIWPCWSP